MVIFRVFIPTLFGNSPPKVQNIHSLLYCALFGTKLVALSAEGVKIKGPEYVYVSGLLEIHF